MRIDGPATGCESSDGGRGPDIACIVPTEVPVAKGAADERVGVDDLLGA